RIRARTASVAIMISVAGQRAMLSVPGTSCCAITAASASESCWRICGWFPAGNVSRMRDMDWMASLVCRVESTRWPVSEAVGEVGQESRQGRVGGGGVQSGEYEMAGLRRRKRRGDGLRVAQLPHQDHVRRLAYE